MSSPNDPLNIPQQTMPQPGRDTGRDTGRVPEPAGDDHPPTMTLAAPQNYDPSKIQSTGGATRTTTDAVPTPGEPGMPRAGRYAVLRSHARGGMGTVSVAHDTELDRDIALKEIHLKYVVDDATRHRFTLEARVTGRLEHPGIVPVYGLGTYPDGRPYYAMRFVSGDSFQQAIDAFHDADRPSRDPAERAGTLRQLLRRFIDVCNTIAYAHSKGYLHRDIKPANVMLGGFGETLVVDWGLAKEMNAPVTMPPRSNVLQPLQSEDIGETAEGFTLYGQTMGTPAFMSPEQAAGKWDITGVASDIYSLGAMLYAIVSGAPPYRGTSLDIITRVQKGEFTPVKEVKGNVPPPLEAVIRKAMAFEIRDRYRTGLELADDVEHWLADEPVSCFRDSFSVRFGRWVKRHRTAVIAAGVILTTAAMALAIGLVAVNRQKEQKQIAYQQAAEDRALARDAVLTLTDDAVGEILASSSTPTPQEQKFLNSLIGTYRSFAAKEPDSAETKLFIAGAWYRVGRLEARVNRVAQSLEAYGLAETMLNAPDLAANNSALKTRGDVHLYRGILKMQQNDAGSVADYHAAIALFEQLVQADPKPEYRARLAQAQDRLGVQEFRRGNLAAAEAAWNASHALRARLAEESPNDTEYQYRLAQSHRQLTSLHLRQGQAGKAMDAGRQAQSILEKLLASDESPIAWRSLLADTETVMANHLALTAPPGAKPNQNQKPFETPALLLARSAAAHWGSVAIRNPRDRQFRLRQAEANFNLAEQCIHHHRPREAVAVLETCFDILNGLQKDQPNDPDIRRRLFQAKILKVSVLREAGDKAAKAAADDAIADALTFGKTDPETNFYIATARIERALVLLQKTETQADAKADLDAAWAIVPTTGRADLLHHYGRAMADYLDAADDLGEAVAVGKQIATVPLPQGRALVAAASFHGRVGIHFKTSKHAEEPDWKDFELNRIRTAFLFVMQAVEAGFNDGPLLRNDPNLSTLTTTPEFQELIRKLK